jgi:tetratricopeptide (TPR) repeat protein
MLKPGTGVYMDGVPRTLISNHNDGMLDMLYGAKPAPRTLTYYIFDLELYQKDLKWYQQLNLRSGSIARGFVREYQFRGPIADSLVAYFSPDGELYTVDGNSDEQPRYSGIADTLAHLSAPDRVIEDKRQDPYGLLRIFGKEPVHDWAYYYERAELKRQEHAWGDVAQLGDAAFHSGYQPSEGIDLLPFIEGYARVGRYDVAEKLTEQALKQSPEIEQELSALWSDVLSVGSAKVPAQVIQELKQNLDLKSGV